MSTHPDEGVTSRPPGSDSRIEIITPPPQEGVRGPAFVVIIAEKSGRQRTQVVRGSELTLGRDRDNDVVLNGDNVSRHHAVVSLGSDGVCTLIDLGSTNGTRVDDVAIGHEAVAIDAEHTIRLGVFALKIMPVREGEESNSRPSDEGDSATTIRETSKPGPTIAPPPDDTAPAHPSQAPTSSVPPVSYTADSGHAYGAQATAASPTGPPNTAPSLRHDSHPPMTVRDDVPHASAATELLREETTRSPVASSGHRRDRTLQIDVSQLETDPREPSQNTTASDPESTTQPRRRETQASLAVATPLQGDLDGLVTALERRLPTGDDQGTATDATGAQLEDESKEALERALNGRLARLGHAPDVTAELREVAWLQLTGTGPWSALLADDKVRRIVTQGVEVSTVSSDEQPYAGYHFASEAAVRRALAALGVVVEGSFVRSEVAGWQVVAVLPPAAPAGPVVELTRIPTGDRIESLVSAGALREADAETIREALREQGNVLVIGPASVAGRVTHAVAVEPPSDSLLLLLDHAHDAPATGALTVVLDGQPSSLHAALSLASTRVRVPPLSGARLLTLLEALTAGRAGVVTSAHGRSADSVLTRLAASVASCGSTGAAGRNCDAIRSWIASCFDLVVQVTQDASGEPQVTQVGSPQRSQLRASPGAASSA